VEARAGRGIAADDAGVLIDRAERLASLVEAASRCANATEYP
jgi:hypothetical protein